VDGALVGFAKGERANSGGAGDPRSPSKSTGVALGAESFWTEQTLGRPVPGVFPGSSLRISSKRGRRIP